MKLRHGACAHQVELIEISGTTVRAAIDGREVAGELEQLGDGSALLTVAGRRYRIAAYRKGALLDAAAGPLSLRLQLADESRAGVRTGLAAPAIYAPMPGKVIRILAVEGAPVETNQTLLVIEAMKMEIPLRAESAAIVKRIHVREGQSVDHGARLIDLAPAPRSDE